MEAVQRKARRPRVRKIPKIILLTCANEQRRPELKFVLELNFYRVIEQDNGQVDLRVTALEIGNRFRVEVLDSGLHLVIGKNADTLTLLAMIEAMCVRKRGPK